MEIEYFLKLGASVKRRTERNKYNLPKTVEPSKNGTDVVLVRAADILSAELIFGKTTNIERRGLLLREHLRRSAFGVRCSMFLKNGSAGRMPAARFGAAAGDFLAARRAKANSQ